MPLEHLAAVSVHSGTEFPLIAVLLLVNRKTVPSYANTYDMPGCRTPDGTAVEPFAIFRFFTPSAFALIVGFAPLTVSVTSTNTAFVYVVNAGDGVHASEVACPVEEQ